LLLTGDLEKQGEKTLVDTYDASFIKADVLKLGHHGSKTSSTRDFLERVLPGLVVISVAQKNVYKHPSKEVLDRLDSLGIRQYKTSEKGSIEVEFSKDGYGVF